MYGSYYLVTVSSDHLSIRDKETILYFKVSAPDLITVEDFFIQEHVPHLNALVDGADYRLRSIDKKYAYSHGEYEMDGEFDLKWEDGEWTWTDLVAS